MMRPLSISRKKHLVRSSPFQHRHQSRPSDSSSWIRHHHPATIRPFASQDEMGIRPHSLGKRKRKSARCILVGFNLDLCLKSRPRAPLSLSESYMRAPTVFYLQTSFQREIRTSFSYWEIGVIHFCGGLWAKATPFSIFPFRPLIQASSSFCSLAEISGRMLTAFSAPLG